MPAALHVAVRSSDGSLSISYLFRVAVDGIIAFGVFFPTEDVHSGPDPRPAPCADDKAAVGFCSWSHSV